MTLRIERDRQAIEIICFLRLTLLELTDAALQQANHRSQQLFREARSRLCARLRDLHERSLFMPRSWPVPEALEAVTVRRESLTAIERGWDDRLWHQRATRQGRHRTPVRTLRWRLDTRW